MRKLEWQFAEEFLKIPIDIDLMENEVFREWIVEGAARTMRQRMRQGEAAMLKRQVTSKFGSLPAEAEDRIANASLSQLERLDPAVFSHVFQDRLELLDERDGAPGAVEILGAPRNVFSRS